MSPDDKTLVNACLRGDDRAFESLLDRYEKPIFNGALRMVGNIDDARDVTQNVFVKVYENLNRFDANYKFFSWIYRIMINESISFMKSRKLENPVDEQLPCKSASPLEQLRGLELSGIVRGALMKLKPDYRTTIILRHFMGCSYRDISDLLEIREDTVKSRLFTARRLMRDEIARKGILTS